MDIHYALWKSYVTVLDMLKDRKYYVSDDDYYNYDDFLEWAGDRTDEEIRKDMTMIYSKKQNTDSKIATIWHSSPVVGNTAITIIHEKMKEYGVTHCILVVQSKITPFAVGGIKMLRVKKIIIEPFFEKELQYNPTHHEDVPRHIICSAQKREEVLKLYAVTKDKLPQIKITEPIARYLGATKGQLIKILRPSETMPYIESNGERKQLFDISYRLVT